MQDNSLVQLIKLIIIAIILFLAYKEVMNRQDKQPVPMPTPTAEIRDSTTNRRLFINNDITTEATNLDDYHDKNEQP